MRLGNFNQFFYFSARSSIGLKIFRQNTYEPACNGWSKRSNKPQSRTTAQHLFEMVTITSAYITSSCPRINCDIQNGDLALISE